MNKFAVTTIMILVALLLQFPLHVGDYSNSNQYMSSTIAVSPNILSTTLGSNNPMGMVAQGEVQNTSSYLGIINLNSLYVSNTTISSYKNTASFQLNAIVEFSVGSENYAYWVQDVAELNTQDRYVYFLDNIWNFSSSEYTLQSNSVTGNGAIVDAGGAWSGDYIYYYEPSSYDNLPGNDVVLNYPTNIQLKVTSAVSNTGYPEIIFQYNDGFGWITYDNTYFFTNSITQDNGFVANGLPTPGGPPYTAGVIMGGYGNGAGTNFQYGGLSLALEYWNGHNYQAPSFALNDGSDTAEGVSGAMVSMFSNHGIPEAMFTSGSDNPGILYTPTQISELIINSPTNTGRISIASTTYGTINASYEGATLEETLIPGTYEISSQNAIPQASTNLDLVRAGFISLNYQTFNASGMPNGKLWGLSFYQDNVPLGNTYYFNSNITAAYIPTEANSYKVYSPLFFQPESNNGIFQQGSTLSINFHNVGYFRGSIYPQVSVIYLNDTLVSVTNGVFNVSLLPGIYNLTAVSQGYTTYNGVIHVYNHSIDYQNITLSKALNPYNEGGPSVLIWMVLGLGMGLIVGSAVMYYALRFRR